MTDDLTRRRQENATSYIEEFLADPDNRRVYEEESRALEQADVEEVRLLEDDNLLRLKPDPLPEWWGPEQDRAMRSHDLCACGHEEQEHCVPQGENDRECLPSVSWAQNSDADEDDDNGWSCVCEHFRRA